MEAKDTREELARLLHEAGRRAVVTGKVLSRPDVSGLVPQAGAAKLAQAAQFTEWDDLPEHAKQGRFIMAEYLLEHGSEVARLVGRTIWLGQPKEGFVEDAKRILSRDRTAPAEPAAAPKAEKHAKPAKKASKAGKLKK